MSEQRADDAQIGALLEQVRREAVTQHVRSDALADPGGFGCEGERFADRLGRRGLAGLARREQVRQGRALAAPILPKPLVERRRQLGFARAITLAMTNEDDPAGPLSQTSCPPAGAPGGAAA